MLLADWNRDVAEICYHGLRMTAEEFFDLGETHIRYELIDGVVCMSPSPTPSHQNIIVQIAHQIASCLDQHPVGNAYVELDVHLGKGPKGLDLVYRPDIIFLSKQRAEECRDRVVGPPDLVVEIISADSRQYDSRTKKSDYERCGVTEYWLIDPLQRTTTFYQRQGDRFAEVKPEKGKLTSKAITGFTLDVERIHRLFGESQIP